MATDPRATAIADSLPVSDDNGDSEDERIPLQDVVVTALEHSEFQHFRIRKYDPDADGVEREWAVVQGLPSAFTDEQKNEVRQRYADEGRGIGDRPWPPFVSLDAATVREGVTRYLNDRLSKGMDEDEARKMVDGVYTDVLVCDSIVQFILYGEEVFG